MLAALPETAQPLLRDQIVALTQTPSGALSFSLVVSILLALWSASGGTSSLMSGINIAYDEQESRNFLKLRGTALAAHPRRDRLHAAHARRWSPSSRRC